MLRTALLRGVLSAPLTSPTLAKAQRINFHDNRPTIDFHGRPDFGNRQR